MRPGDLTSSCSSAAWIRAAATPARRRAGAAARPCFAERFDDQRAACRSLWRDAWRCVSEPDLLEALSSAKDAWAPTVNSGAGGQLSSVGGPVVGTPAPRSRPVQPAHRRLTSRCADADTGGAFWSLARPGACHDRLRSVVREGRCGPAHAVGAGLFGCSPGWARSWALVCSRSSTSAIPVRFRPACTNSAIRRSRSRLCWLYQRVPPLVPA